MLGPLAASWFAFFVSALVLTGAPTAGAQEVIELRHKFAVGQRSEYRIRHDLALAMNVRLPGWVEQQSASVTTQTEVTARTMGTDSPVQPQAKAAVPAGDDGRVALRLDRLGLRVVNGNQVFELDTGADKSGVDVLLGRVLSDLERLLGREFTVTLSRRGVVREVAGLRALAGDALLAGGLRLDGEMLERFDEVVLVGLLTRPGWPLLPDKPVRVGDRWYGPLVGDPAALDNAAGQQAAVPRAPRDPAAEPLDALNRAVGDARHRLGQILTATYTLDGIDTRDGRRVARIAIDIKPRRGELESLSWVLPVPQIQGTEVRLGLSEVRGDGQILWLVDEGQLVTAKLDVVIKLSARATLLGENLGFEIGIEGRQLVDRTSR